MAVAVVLAVMLDGRQTCEVDDAGQPRDSASVLMLFNAFHEPLPFKLPGLRDGGWTARIDTARDDGVPVQPNWLGGDTHTVDGRSMVVLTQ